jgi:hypothetical protein
MQDDSVPSPVWRRAFSFQQRQAVVAFGTGAGVEMSRPTESELARPIPTPSIMPSGARTERIHVPAAAGSRRDPRPDYAEPGAALGV